MALTSAQKLAKINRRRNKYERLWLLEMARWIDGFLLEYAPPQITLSDEQAASFKAMATRIVMAQAGETIGVNLNDFKAEDDSIEILNNVYRDITGRSMPVLTEQIDKTTAGMRRETVNFMARTNAITEVGSPPPVYRTTLKNYLYNHRLTVAVSNTTMVDETVRYYTIRSVKDPLKNSVLQTLNLIEAGDINGARRLNAKIRRLTNLPLAGSQERVIDLISTPLTQANAIANVRADAQRLDKQQKKWSTVGDGDVRPSHVEAGNAPPIQVDEPFMVGGAPMQYPMDGSLGAPLSEIIGCRCVTEYV